MFVHHAVTYTQPCTRTQQQTHDVPPCATVPRRVGRVGRQDTMGLAISLVSTVPEKVREQVARVCSRVPYGWCRRQDGQQPH